MGMFNLKDLGIHPKDPRFTNFSNFPSRT